MKGPCEVCKIPQSDQHSLSQSGKCDAIRGGKLESWNVKVGKKL
jgi:hypothetical protein